MIKLLWYSDFLCGTGFSRVAEKILLSLIADDMYDITVIGIGYYGELYDRSIWPLDVIPAIKVSGQNNPSYSDVFSRQRLLDEISTGKYDIIFTLQDPFIISAIGKKIKDIQRIMQKKHPFKWIYYYPVDGDLFSEWVENSVYLADYPVAYTQYGRRMTVKVNGNVDPLVIPHGIDLDTFRELPRQQVREFKNHIFGGKFKDKFVITNVGVNSRRKNFWQTLYMFKKMKESGADDARLYLHTVLNYNNEDLEWYAKSLGLIPNQDYFYPNPTSIVENQIDDLTLNLIYNMSNVVVNNSLGEGWGLPIVEAMATNTPVVAPAHSSFNEIIGDDRGTLIPVIQQAINLGQSDNFVMRPIPDTNEYVKIMMDIYNEWKKRKSKTKTTSYMTKSMRGCDYTKTLNWDYVNRKWTDLFKEVTRALADGA